MDKPTSSTIQRRLKRTALAFSVSVAFGHAAPALAQTAAAHAHDQAAADAVEIQPMQPAAPNMVASPVPPLTDADRNAVFHGGHMHDMGDAEINYLVLFDKLEWQHTGGGNALNWEGTAWVGGDIDRLWIRSEGKRTGQGLEAAEVQALWGHAISPWWDVVGGVRHDFKPGRSQTWAAFGLQGLALYNFEAEATAYVGQAGQTAARLEAKYELLITNRLVLQPTAEINIYGKNDASRGIGAGLSSTSLGLRLRYELDRQFAPYIGVNWDRSYGNTARFAEQEGQRRSEVSFVAGVRAWF
ncbi:copper resistance protein B [Pandoraea terrigena]|uniref:Copper resistance protein B n=1 Tax=Pandoraea terrigena TaxID=2508292 RepID=A0A5E4WRW3_9BURK|nr:copper resistance protein B [Pandoraea terrigena]VVE27657.1 copper resistance protein B [Pandoraea terrigena]